MEILVAVVILAIGVLGMAAMTTLVIRANTGAGSLTQATNLCQIKMEELRDQRWSLLGNPDDPLDSSQYLQVGLPSAYIVQVTGRNSEGKTAEEVCEEEGYTPPCAEPTPSALVRSRGPYKYTRSFLICKGGDYQGTAADPIPPAGSWPDPLPTPLAGFRPNENDCRVDPADDTTRTEAVACRPNDITFPGEGSREKKIKTLCAWRDGSGACHSVSLETTVVDY